MEDVEESVVCLLILQDKGSFGFELGLEGLVRSFRFVQHFGIVALQLEIFFFKDLLFVRRAELHREGKREIPKCPHWLRLGQAKPGAKNSIWGSYVGGRGPGTWTFFCCISGKPGIGRESRTQTQGTQMECWCLKGFFNPLHHDIGPCVGFLDFDGTLKQVSDAAVSQIKRPGTQ